jgi:hypothetical protein
MWGLFYLTDGDRIHARIVVRATVRFIFVLGDHVITSERSELAPPFSCVRNAATALALALSILVMVFSVA